MQTYDQIHRRLQSKVTHRLHRPAAELDFVQQQFLSFVADELSNVYRELGQSKDYIQKNVLRKLRKEFDNRPKPAHGLAQKQPKKHGEILNPEDDPFTIQRFSNEPPFEIYFTPLRPTKLVNAKIRWCARAEELLDLTKETGEQRVLTSKNQKTLHQSVIWCGIELGEDFDLKEDLTMHLSFSDSEKLRKNLPFFQCFSSEENLKTTVGFGDWLQPMKTPKNQFLDTEYLFLWQLEKEILEKYAPEFLTIQCPENHWKTNQLPKDFKEIFEASALTEKIDKPVIWLKMILPSGFQISEVKQLGTSLNCFPVVNRKLDKSRDQEYLNEDFIEVIPLSKANTHRRSLQETRDYFLGIKKVGSEGRVEYRPTTFEKFEEVPRGYYALQTGRVEANDFRDFQNRAEELIYFLKNESQRLAKFCDGNVQTALSDIETALNDLQTGLTRSPQENCLEEHFLHVKVLPQQQMIYVEFWVTQGEVGKDLFSNNLIL